MNTASSQPTSLSTHAKWLLGIVSFVLVAFGQPAWSAWTGPLAAAFGYAIFWLLLLDIPSRWRRFGLATAWFTAVQLVQLGWFISHPYIYIYGVYFLLALWLGSQFGIISLFIRPNVLKPVGNLLAIAALWVILEWSRLQVLSGLSWNPVGLALGGNLYAMQWASLAGVFGLSFWVIWVNLLALRAYISPSSRERIGFSLAWVCALLLPYLFGGVQLAIHNRAISKEQLSPSFNALLVQTAFAPEECDLPKVPRPRVDPITAVIDEWRQILRIIKKFEGKPIDLMVLPEFVVPFGTYAYAFPASAVYKAFYEELGPSSLDHLPPMQYPYSSHEETLEGSIQYVNNAFWAQGIANNFHAGLVVGLEDAQDNGAGVREYYSAALFFPPKSHYEAPESFQFPIRYEKRVLVPMGEYIPFEFCRNLAARYGVGGSFTCGTEPKVIHFRGLTFSPSICYEETYGNIMREARRDGAEILVNLTSDVWYPNSRLMRQHLDHARLRTVENGFPLIRACNTGITAAIDSLGRIVAVLGGGHPEAVEWIPDALYVEVPTYTYSTLYSRTGDALLLGICSIILLMRAMVAIKW